MRIFCSMTLIMQDSVSPVTRKAIAVALARFPELRRTAIVFRHASIFTTMNAIPRKDFMMRRKKYRIYHINIAKKTKQGMLLDGLDLQEQVGCIAHELTHIVDYENMSVLHILGFGAAYLFSKRFRRKVEHRTDMRAIDRGFGREVHAFVTKLEGSISGRYQRLKQRIYLDADEIFLYMQSLEEADPLTVPQSL